MNNITEGMNSTVEGTVLTKDSLSQVKEFMTTFKQPVHITPTVPSEALVKFRLKLILEELAEIARDCGASKEFGKLLMDKYCETLIHLAKLDVTGKEEVPTLKGILDNLVDLRYVADGMVHAFGLGDVFNPAFNDVHNANMAKICYSMEEAQLTVDKYRNEGVETYFEVNGDKWLIYRTSDKKALKSHKWKEADLTKYIE